VLSVRQLIWAVIVHAPKSEKLEVESRETRFFLLLTKKDLQAIGATIIPEMPE
jgi:hypothetical protein